MIGRKYKCRTEKKNEYFFIPINRITFSRYSSNVCCSKRSSKWCNRAFRFANSFFRGGQRPIAKWWCDDVAEL